MATPRPSAAPIAAARASSPWPRSASRARSRWRSVGLPVQFGALVDEEPDDAPLQGDRVRASRRAGRSGRSRPRPPGGRAAQCVVRVGVAAGHADPPSIEQDDRGDPGPRQRRDELLGLGRARSRRGQCRAGMIARSPGSSASNAGARALQDADPADLTRRPLTGQPRRPEDPGVAGTGPRCELAQRGHRSAAGPRATGGRPRGRRAAARTRARRPRTGRIATTMPRPPAASSRVQTRRRGK